MKCWKLQAGPRVRKSALVNRTTKAYESEQLKLLSHSPSTPNCRQQLTRITLPAKRFGRQGTVSFLHAQRLPRLLSRLQARTLPLVSESSVTGSGSGGAKSARERAAHPLRVCEIEEAIAAAVGHSEMYSVWATPKGRLGEQLKGEIAHLAERYGSAPFPPHVTVLGDIEKPREEAVALMKELAKQVKKYRINFVNVTRGTKYFTCVYLLAVKDEGTLAAAAATRNTFGMTTPPYMPHLSLLYSDMDEGQRVQVVEYETARLYGESSGYETLLVDTGYDVNSLALWYTPLEDKSMTSWCLVEEFELS